MPSFESLLKDKNRRLEEIPLALQTTVQKQQRRVLNDIISQLDTLTTVNGKIKIDSANLKAISTISDELKTVFLNDDYLRAVNDFAKEFDTQASLNNKLIDKGFGSTENPIASKTYIDLAKKNAINDLVGAPAQANFIQPVQDILETAVINNASINDTIDNLRIFVEGDEEVDSKILKYAKQITNDSFAIADRSYTSIVSDTLGNDWFYYAGSEVNHTRCFCHQRVGNYYHYLEVESWGDGQNLGDCDLGDGTWAGEIGGTNSSTIYSFLGGYNCMHSLMPVSEAVVPESDITRTRGLGFID